MCWPCCPTAIYRLNSDNGTAVWSRGWGNPYPFTSGVDSIYNQGNFGTYNGRADISSIDTDGISIYAGGRHSSLVTDFTARKGMSVVKFSQDGDVQWVSDVGGAVSHVLYVPGVGVAVTHVPSIPATDTVVIDCPTTLPQAFVLRTKLGSLAVAGTSSSADVQAAVNATVLLRHRVTVAGTSLAAAAGGLRFSFHQSMGGVTGYFPLPLARAVNNIGVTPLYSNPFRVYAPNVANFTLLDPDDGSIIWRMYLPSSGYDLPGAVAFWRGCFVIPNAGLGFGVFSFVTTAGVITSLSLGNTFARSDGFVVRNVYVNSGNRYKAVGSNGSYLLAIGRIGFFSGPGAQVFYQNGSVLWDSGGVVRAFSAKGLEGTPFDQPLSYYASGLQVNGGTSPVISMGGDLWTTAILSGVTGPTKVSTYFQEQPPQYRRLEQPGIAGLPTPPIVSNPHDFCGSVTAGMDPYESSASSSATSHSSASSKSSASSASSNSSSSSVSSASSSTSSSSVDSSSSGSRFTSTSSASSSSSISSSASLGDQTTPPFMCSIGSHFGVNESIVLWNGLHSIVWVNDAGDVIAGNDANRVVPVTGSSVCPLDSDFVVAGELAHL